MLARCLCPAAWLQSESGNGLLFQDPIEPLASGVAPESLLKEKPVALIIFIVKRGTNHGRGYVLSFSVRVSTVRCEASRLICCHASSWPHEYSHTPRSQECAVW